MYLQFNWVYYRIIKENDENMSEKVVNYEI